MMDLKPLARAAGCITLAVLLSSCSRKEEAPSAERASAVSADLREEAAAAPPPPPAAAAAAAQDKAGSVTNATQAEQMGSSAVTFNDGDRKFIRTANARFKVKDVYVSALGIEDTVASHGGFVVKNDIRSQSMNTTTHPMGEGKLMELNEYTVQGHLIVRVPSARTQEFLRAIVGHIVFLDNRNFEARDAQFDLLRQQLEMMRNQETQQELGQAVQDGGKLIQKTDAIGMRNSVKAERDGALLAKKEFEDQVAFSTIALQLYQPSKVLQSERIDVDAMFRMSRPGFFSRLGEQMRSGWDGLLDFLVALAGIWPVLLIGGVAGTALWRFKRRGRKAAPL
jgi:hypothetical protein